MCVFSQVSNYHVPCVARGHCWVSAFHFPWFESVSFHHYMGQARWSVSFGEFYLFYPPCCCRNARMTDIYFCVCLQVASGDQNSDPHTCMPRTFPTDPALLSLQSFYLIRNDGYKACSHPVTQHHLEPHVISSWGE